MRDITVLAPVGFTNSRGEIRLLVSAMAETFRPSCDPTSPSGGALPRPNCFRAGIFCYRKSCSVTSTATQVSTNLSSGGRQDRQGGPGAVESCRREYF